MPFIPDPLAIQAQDVPFFEDSQKRDVPGRGTGKTVPQLQAEVVEMLARLGGAGARFVPGTFDGARRRYGYEIWFWYGGTQGRMDCAALPIRKETDRKKDRALAQALYLLRDELRALVHSQMYKPGAIPLVPYLIGAGGKTVTEFLIETQNVPQLGAGDTP